MSGLINSAGSRSGVIGTTEIDYEEGTWTPTSIGSGGSYDDCNYTRIGNKVFIVGDITFGTSAGTGGSGLPFNIGEGDLPGYIGYGRTDTGVAGYNAQFVFYTNTTALDVSSTRQIIGFNYSV